MKPSPRGRTYTITIDLAKEAMMTILHLTQDTDCAELRIAGTALQELKDVAKKIRASEVT